MTEAILHFDGGARPRNPGHAGCASVLTIGRYTYVCSRYLGRNRTNNSAEYTGLLLGINMAIERGVRDLQIITDSQLIEGHLAKGWKSRVFELTLMKREAEDKLGKKFDDWEISWVKRSKNKIADEYCTKAILFGMNQNPFRRKKIDGGVEPEIVDWLRI